MASKGFSCGASKSSTFVRESFSRMKKAYPFLTNSVGILCDDINIRGSSASLPGWKKDQLEIVKSEAGLAASSSVKTLR